MTPFNRNGSGDPTLNEMHLFSLPWPVEALRMLSPETNVTLRITLSYFIEPNPSQKGFRRQYSYQSHGLRFAVIRPNQTFDNFRASINVMLIMKSTMAQKEMHQDGPWDLS